MQRKYKVKAAFRVVCIYFISMGAISLLELIIGIFLNIYDMYDSQFVKNSMLTIIPVLFIGIPLFIISVIMETNYRNYKSYQTIKMELRSIEYTIAGLLLVFMAASGLFFRLYSIVQYLPIIMRTEPNARDIFFKYIITNNVVGVILLLVQVAIGLILFFRGKSKSKPQGEGEAQ